MGLEPPFLLLRILTPSACQGAAFGLAVSDAGGILRLAAVEDATNSLDIWTFQTGGNSSRHDDQDDQGDQNNQDNQDNQDDIAVPGAPGPMASQASSLPQAPVTLVGTTVSSASASPSEGAQATIPNRKGVTPVSLALGEPGLRSALVGSRHSLGHKHHKVGAAGHSTNNPLSYPTY